MRAVFKGVTYRLEPLFTRTDHSICNIVAHMDHIGSVTKNELGRCSTPQVYQIEGRKVAAVVRDSNFVNEVWEMRSFDYIPVPVPAL